MLELKQIIKDYDSGDATVRALDGVSIDFRQSEFVSILGPSGCGKTTLLNIIGGLDQYTSGDLIINGVSTKLYKDADWDTYRNHSIGFVFQSYNLIPHQTVLANVELALTLSGISKQERRERAIEALRQVGLADQLKKRPAQMSGGQMQRVAIARALVNNPDILLADEPTGALDTQTSVQIMDILREVAKTKLVIMVTHNPELAAEYSTRIIRVLDGKVVDDSNPFDASAISEEAAAQETAVEAAPEVAPAQVEPKKKAKKNAKKKKSMSFFTALSLSLNNLMTKKARTFLTSFAGSIGIIGIALILSVSAGVNNYIDAIQRDTLSAYPLTIQKETQDFNAMLSAMTKVDEDKNADFDSDKIYVDDSMGTMMSAMTQTIQNNLVRFKAYIEENYDDIKDYVSDIQYTYDFDLQVYRSSEFGLVQINPSKILDSMGSAFAGMSEMMEMGGGFSIMSEMLNNQALLEEQYELVGEGSYWPTNKNEVVLVVTEHNRISKMALYMLGVLDQSELEGIMKDLMTEGKYDEPPIEPFKLEEFLGMEFMLLNTSDFFTQTDKTYEVNGVEYPVWSDLRNTYTDERLESFIAENGVKLKISGIVRPREGATATSITGTIGYTKALTDYILEQNTQSEVINQQKATPTHNVLTGLEFTRTEYTRENIWELIDKIDDATMEQFYMAMTQTIFGNPEYAAMLNVNKDSFIGFFSIMPPEYQAELIETMLQIALQNDPSGASLYPIMGVMTGMLNVPSTTVTADNFLQLMPLMNSYQLLVLLGGPEMQMGEGGTFVIPENPTVPGLITLCGDEAMTGIYEGMTAALPSLSLDEHSFNMLMQNQSFITDAMFEELKEMLYKMAPQTDATLDSVLLELGDAEKASPASINFYAKDFESKQKIEEFIAGYNEKASEDDQIHYTDVIGIMMSSVSTIVNAISYVLIAFVSISLVVSSIMIGIITYISVLERTKEIGILRAIGASKRDIRRVFNAETLIVGFVAGAIAIIATLGFNLIINVILFHVTEIEALKAVLPWGAAIILVGISMLLTFIAGLFPASFAAKRNPVEALRSE